MNNLISLVIVFINYEMCNNKSGFIHNKNSGLEMKTVFVILAFIYQKHLGKRELIAEPVVTCVNAEDAIKKAERLSQSKVGVVAVSQEVAEDDFCACGRSVELIRFGFVPDGLLADY